MPLLLTLALAACGNDFTATENSKCDGQAQPGEKTVDDAFDRDGDGYLDGNNPDCAEAYAADQLDCDDGNPDVHPSTDEIDCNDVDEDCDGVVGGAEDADADGVAACEDCNDADGAAFPGNVEVDCNLIDDDCDASTPDGLDQDGDGFTLCEDCNDLSAVVSPGLSEVACNTIDDDCDEATSDRPDVDGDGADACSDCDDGDATRFPGAEEICDDAIDNDCDADTDEECDYSGTWTMDRNVSYSCAYGFVNVSFGQLQVTDTYPTIAVSNYPVTSQPGTMTGTFATPETFLVSSTLSGTCDETYTLSGTFTSNTEMSATFTASYVGSWCFDCTDNSWTFTANR